MAAPFADGALRGRLNAPTPTESLAAVGVAGMVVAFALPPEHIADGPVICPFRRLTGSPCPGCGLTRSWVYLAHGWWRDSFLANPFGAVSVLLVLALAVAVVVARVRHRDAPDLDVLIRRRWVLVVVAAWLTFAAVRIGVDVAT